MEEIFKIINLVGLKPLPVIAIIMLTQILKNAFYIQKKRIKKLVNIGISLVIAILITILFEYKNSIYNIILACVGNWATANMFYNIGDILWTKKL